MRPSGRQIQEERIQRGKARVGEGLHVPQAARKCLLTCLRSFFLKSPFLLTILRVVPT